MHDEKQVLIIQGVSNIPYRLWIEQELPFRLSKSIPVVCFEYPSFRTLINIFLGRRQTIEYINSRLIIYHSIGLFPFGRSILLINIVNHLLNLFYILFVKKIITRNVVILSFTPEGSIISSVMRKNIYIYYVLDNYFSLPWWNSKLRKINLTILDWLSSKLALKIITASESLYDKYKKSAKNMLLFPTPIEGISLRSYRFKSKPEPKGIIFIGSFFDWKIDFDLMIKLLETFPDHMFKIIGLIDNKSEKIKLLFTYQNFQYAGYLKKKSVIDEIIKAAVCIIPYKTDLYGKYAYPVKVMEYLVLSKPVVTTALPSLHFLAGKKLIYWSKDHKSFIQYLKLALNEKGFKKLNFKRNKIAYKYYWGNRIKLLTKFIYAKNH